MREARGCLLALAVLAAASGPVAAQVRPPVSSFDFDVPTDDGAIWTLTRLGGVHGVTAAITFEEVRGRIGAAVPRFIVSAGNARGSVTLSVGSFDESKGLEAVMDLEWADSVRIPDLKADTARFPGTFRPGDTLRVELRWTGSGVTAVVNGSAKTLRLLDAPTDLSIATLSAEVKATSVSFLGTSSRADSARFSVEMGAPAGRNSSWTFEDLGSITGVSGTVSIDSIRPDYNIGPFFYVAVLGKRFPDGFPDGSARLELLGSLKSTAFVPLLRSWPLDSATHAWGRPDSATVGIPVQAKQRIPFSLQWNAAGMLIATVNGRRAQVPFHGKPARMLLMIGSANMKVSPLRFTGW